jgi:hypothetical protein
MKTAAAGMLGMLSAVVTAGWAGAALSVVIVVTLVGAVCWVINDQNRPERLALLIKSWRGIPSSRSAARDRR